MTNEGSIQADASDSHELDVEAARVCVEERCASAEIDCHFETESDGTPLARLVISAGRDKRAVSFRGRERIIALLGVPFERYRYLPGYEAICSLENQYIEATLGPVGLVPAVSGMSFVRTFLPRHVFTGNPQWPPRLVIGENDNGEGMTLEIGQRSDVARVLCPSRFRESEVDRTVSLTLRGVKATTSNTATKALETYGNALFFQIDSKIGVPIQLVRLRERVIRRRRASAGSIDHVTFPNSAYDHEPMSLYWYARGADRMPLLQFLAYYQVMEFYFPVHAQKEIRRRLRNVVKSPSFSPHSEREIGRLVEVLSSTTGRSIWSDERSQLLATLRDCLDANSVRNLISSDRYGGHFEKKVKRLVTTTLRVQSSDDELVTRTAERIYEIRCRIVHTKERNDEDNIGLLLPFSREADELGPDIELVELASRSVLTAAGQPIE